MQEEPRQTASILDPSSTKADKRHRNKTPKGLTQSICQRLHTSKPSSWTAGRYVLSRLPAVPAAHSRQAWLAQTVAVCRQSYAKPWPPQSLRRVFATNSDGRLGGQRNSEKTRQQRSKSLRHCYRCTCCRPRWWRRGVGAAHDLFIIFAKNHVDGRRIVGSYGRCPNRARLPVHSFRLAPGAGQEAHV